MSFIRFQNIKTDAQGVVTSGSASVMRCVYDKEAKHKNRQVVGEKLGKVLWMAPDKHSGVFMSPTRGLVEFDSATGTFTEVGKDDPRIAGRDFGEPGRRVEFGTLDLFLSFMKSISYTPLLKSVFPNERDFGRVMAHLYHFVTKLGSKVACDDYVGKSFLPHLMPDLPVASLETDSRHYAMMGSEKVKAAFFRAYVEMMRKTEPGFGKAAIIDSTDITTEAEGLPFAAPATHGSGKPASQIRLVLVLDKATLLPVWYHLIPGDIIDVNTLDQVRADVLEFLDIEIDDYTLDAGYCSKELVREFFPPEGGDAPKTDAKLVVRMPAKKGYPFKTVFHEKKSSFSDPRRTFLYNGHTYFGDCIENRELFGRPVRLYVYVDRENAANAYRKFLEEADEADVEKLTYSELLFKQYSGGYFALVSNIEGTPREVLAHYFERVDVETLFKTAKDQDILPLAKRTPETARGKLLNDIIGTMVYVKLRAKANAGKFSTPKLIGTMQSSSCLVRSEGSVAIDYPTKKTKEAWKLFGRDFGKMVTLDSLRNEYGLTEEKPQADKKGKQDGDKVGRT